jgi:ERCC4-type nuclease
MKILIDTREQKPLRFKHKQISEVITKKLDIGDYGCQFEDGHVVPIFFERKSISDLYGTLGKGYSRFKKEVNRALDSKSQLIIIVEGSLTDVSRGTCHCKRKPQSLIDQVFTLFVKHGLMPVFCTNRAEMSAFITNFYIACGKQYLCQKNLKKVKE